MRWLDTAFKWNGATGGAEENSRAKAPRRKGKGMSEERFGVRWLNAFAGEPGGGAPFVEFGVLDEAVDKGERKWSYGLERGACR